MASRDSTWPPLPAAARRVLRLLEDPVDPVDGVRTLWWRLDVTQSTHFAATVKFLVVKYSLR